MKKIDRINEGDLLQRRSKMISDLLEDGLMEKHLERKNTKPSNLKIADLVWPKDDANQAITP